MQSGTALCGIAEAAVVLGVLPRTVSGYVARGTVMPEPFARLACGPIWLREDVERVAAERDGRARARVDRVERAWDAVVDAAFAEADVPEYRRSEQARRNVHNGRVARAQAGRRRDGKLSGSVSKYRNQRILPNVKAELRDDVEERLRERLAATERGAEVLRELERAARLRTLLLRREERRAGIAA